MYNVKGPHHLWHMDGHHKLIRYRLVTHGCIDGNTRYIIDGNTINHKLEMCTSLVLPCAMIRAVIDLGIRDNNKSHTVLSLFEAGVKEFTMPWWRERGDQGGENVLVADYMIQHRGVGRGSYLAGSSKFNTR